MKQQTGRKMLGILLTLALVLGLLPGMNLTAYATEYTEYPLWVGGKQVTSANAGNIDGSNKASYDADTKTLTLNGFSSDTTYCPNPSSSWPIHVVIYSTEDLTINLKGNNTITTETTDFHFGISMADWKTLTIEGKGSLKATGYNGISTGRSSLRIKGGKLNISGSNYGINCNNSSTGSGSESVIISGGNVEIEGGEAGLASSGYISVTGGTIHIHATGASKKAINNEIRVGSEVVGSQSTDGSNWGALENSQDGRYVVSSGYSYAKFEAEKSAATVTTAPKANDLSYNGKAQELVTSGTATGGEMQYALGTATEATGPYTTSIPSKTEAGTYYVWYKAVGDATHTDSDAACVTVTIAAKPAPTEAPTSVPTATPKPVPKTGDNANPALWLAMMLVALIGFAGLAVTGTMKASRKKK